MSATMTHTWADVAREVWPDAVYVTGEGPFATVRGCGGRLTVVLHADLGTARHALRSMHPGAVRDCSSKHVLIELAVPKSGAV